MNDNVALLSGSSIAASPWDLLFSFPFQIGCRCVLISPAPCLVWDFIQLCLLQAPQVSTPPAFFSLTPLHAQPQRPGENLRVSRSGGPGTAPPFPGCGRGLPGSGADWVPGEWGGSTCCAWLREARLSNPARHPWASIIQAIIQASCAKAGLNYGLFLNKGKFIPILQLSGVRVPASGLRSQVVLALVP